MRCFATTLVLLLTLPICNIRAQETDAQAKLSTKVDAVTGKAIFQAHCALCHVVRMREKDDGDMGKPKKKPHLHTRAQSAPRSGRLPTSGRPFGPGGSSWTTDSAASSRTCPSCSCTFGIRAEMDRRPRGSSPAPGSQMAGSN